MSFFFKSKKNKVNSNRELEVEEIFLDNLLKRREPEPEISERKLELPLRKRAFFLFFLFGAFLLILLLAFSFNLQVREHQKYTALALRNKFITLSIQAQRGVIYDRNMEQLVFNEVKFDLLAKKSEFPQDQQKQEEVLLEVAEILGEDPQNLKRKITENSQDLVTLRENLSHKNLILIETKIDDLPGIKVKKRTQRVYEGDETLSHILGYLGKISAKELERLRGDYEFGDYVGKEGVERWYEEVLAEKKGVLEIERDVQGQEISREIKENPQSGNSLILSLDFSLQKKIEEVLFNILEEVGVEKGAVVALDPRNGEILASVSLPSFNNNLFARGITTEELKELNEDERDPQLNRVIGGSYPTGSMIKPLIGLAALEENIVSESTQLYCPLELCVLHKYTGEPECFPDWTFHGWTNMRRAIAESVNPFFYMVGGGYVSPPTASEFFNPNLPKKFEGLGVGNIASYLRLFGLGEKTGIDLPGEVEGRVPDPDWKKNYFETPEQQKWYLGDTYNLSIGQGYFLTTPLQMATAFQALANGGKIFRPKIAKEILVADGNQKEVLGEELIKENFISSESLGIIREGMLQAVSSPAGSAFSLSSLPGKVAAKTGTAQLSPKKEIYHNWITVFAPNENPEILLTIVIEEVKGTRIAAQKVAKEVLEWYFSNETIRSD